MFKFRGTLIELKEALAACGVRGQWDERPDGVFMLRCACCLYGANLHWARGSKSLWFSGKADPRAELEKRVIAMLDQSESPPRDAA